MDWSYQREKIFSALQDPALLFAVQKLHLEVAIPTNKTMCTVLLDQAYDTRVAHIKSAASGKFVMFTTDSWTNVNDMSVLNYVASYNGNTYYLESVYTGSISRDTAYITADLNRLMVKYSFSKPLRSSPTTPPRTRAWGPAQTRVPSGVLQWLRAHGVHLMVTEICTSISR